VNPRDPSTASTGEEADLLVLPALEVHQGPARRLYLFGVDGKRLPEFATISRVHRDVTDQVNGYQRPEVLAHIAEIRRYLESDHPLVPNALVVAFDERVTFIPAAGADRSAYSVPGELVIPLDPKLPDDEKPGWIVDGQQRTAAIREARLDAFPISVVGFIAESAEEQRAQFILVNATKPLPKSLIYELLPATDAALPGALRRKQLPARLIERLNFDGGSPLEGMIQTATSPDGHIKDNSMLRALENSISDGALYRYRDPVTGDGDVEAMIAVLKPFWNAVELVFPHAWDLPPRKSRLMHGAGVVSMSFLMDTIAEPLLDAGPPSIETFVRELQLIAPVCHWTGGDWDFGDGILRHWNQIQNTPRDVQLLANHLLVEYRKRSAPFAHT